MDDIQDSEHPPVYHADDQDTSPDDAELLRKHWAGNPPRLFALIQEFEDDEDEDQIEREIVAYGIMLPDGSATTVGAGGSGFGRFGSAIAASDTYYSDLVWLSPAR
jgi:hypothetical protein